MHFTNVTSGLLSRFPHTQKVPSSDPELIAAGKALLVGGCLDILVVVGARRVCAVRSVGAIGAEDEFAADDADDEGFEAKDKLLGGELTQRLGTRMVLV